MKLDNDVVRDLLLQIEGEQDSPDCQLPIGDKDDYSRFYAATKLVEAGFIKAERVQAEDGECCIIFMLTYAGHEFLDKVRDSKIWKAVKEAASKAGVETLK